MLQQHTTSSSYTLDAHAPVDARGCDSDRTSFLSLTKLHHKAAPRTVKNNNCFQLARSNYLIIRRWLHRFDYCHNLFITERVCVCVCNVCLSLWGLKVSAVSEGEVYECEDLHCCTWLFKDLGLWTRIQLGPAVCSCAVWISRKMFFPAKKTQLKSEQQGKFILLRLKHVGWK